MDPKLFKGLRLICCGDLLALGKLPTILEAVRVYIYIHIYIYIYIYVYAPTTHGNKHELMKPLDSFM